MRLKNTRFCKLIGQLIATKLPDGSRIAYDKNGQGQVVALNVSVRPTHIDRISAINYAGMTIWRNMWAGCAATDTRWATERTAKNKGGSYATQNVLDGQPSNDGFCL